MLREPVQLTCHVCGERFESRGRNAKFCPDCAKRRKAEQDHAAWIRKKYRQDISNREQCKELEACIPVIETQHMKFLGLNPYYYGVFKETRRVAYKQWVREHIPMALAASATRK